MSLFDRLPLELRSHILGYCHEASDGKYVPQETLARCLRVSKAFFLDTAPHLYRRPVVAHVGAFFSGMIDPLTTYEGAGDEVPSDLSYLAKGHTKNPLLRHVECLTIVPRDFTSDSTACAVAKQSRSISHAYRILDRITHPDISNPISPYTPSHPVLHVMPKFDAISLGRKFRLEDPVCLPIRDDFESSIDRLLSLIFRAGELPKVLCHSMFPGKVARETPEKWMEGALPRMVITHKRFAQGAVSLAWGTHPPILG
ncbi:hypothetical protein IAT38_007473 [Cryptococcus sp. DSM 104549]